MCMQQSRIADGEDKVMAAVGEDPSANDSACPEALRVVWAHQESPKKEALQLDHVGSFRPAFGTGHRS